MTQSDVIVRLMQRRAHSPVKELQDWQSLHFTKRARRSGEGQIVFPQHEMPQEATDLFALDNLAIWIRHAIPLTGVEGEDVGELVTTFHGPVNRLRFSTETELFTLVFADNLSYIFDRTAESNGAASVDPGQVSCVAYIRSLLNSELLAPSDGDRAIDIPAQLAGLEEGGSILDLPVRWGSLGDHISRALIDGSCFITADLNNDVVSFEVSPVDDQTAGSGGTVAPLSPALSGSDMVIDINHRERINRYYVLGSGTGASRTVRTRTASTVTGRLREAVVDARHLGTDNDALDALGDVMLDESAEAESTFEVINVDDTMDVRPGMKVTAVAKMAGDATSFDVGPIDLNVLAKTWTLSSRADDDIRVFVGHEPTNVFQLLRNVTRPGEQSAFE